jgi:hypothetical protein
MGDVTDVPQPPFEIHVSLKGTNRRVSRVQMVRMRMWARVQVWEQTSRNGDKTSNIGPDTDTTPADSTTILPQARAAPIGKSNHQRRVADRQRQGLTPPSRRMEMWLRRP